MQTKLHINLTQGIIDVEGDPELVKSVYEDFKDRMLGHDLTPPPAAKAPQAAAAEAPSSDKEETKKKKRRSSSKKKTIRTERSESSIDANNPVRDKDLDTSKLKAFHSQFAPKNASENILIFLKFLIEQLGIEKPNTDQVYTCFLGVGTKPPGAFKQAFADTSSKKGYIDFNSAEDLVITTKGNNHFEFDLKRAEAE